MPLVWHEKWAIIEWLQLSPREFEQWNVRQLMECIAAKQWREDADAELARVHRENMARRQKSRRGRR